MGQLNKVGIKHVEVVLRIETRLIRRRVIKVTQYVALGVTGGQDDGAVCLQFSAKPCLFNRRRQLIR